MSEYRDDLGAAHRRIALLEEQLGMRAPALPARRTGIPLVAWLIAASGITLFVGVFGAVTGLFGLGRPARVEPGPLPAAVVAETAPPRLQASWYTQVGVLPTLVDVDGDGTKDLVGLFWRSGQDATPLYAAAVDGKTFHVKWSAGPYPSQWSSTRSHLAVVGNKVVVTDSHGMLHVLELASGHELAEQNVEGGVTEVCARGDGSARAIVRGVNGTTAESRLFDVDTTTFAPLPEGVSCQPRYEVCAPSKPGGPSCFVYGAVPRAPKGATSSSSFYVARTLREGTLAVALGTKPATANAGREEAFAVGFSANAGVSTWRQPLVVEGDEMHLGAAQSELRGNTFVTFYPTKAGPFRLVARHPASGAIQWSELVPGSHEGSYAAAFGIESDRVLVVMNQTLHVFDAATGAHLAALDAASL